MLELEDMKVSCVTLKDDYQGISKERKLLRPTSFKLFVKRSLSSWYETLPDLDVSGRMHTIAVSFCLLNIKQSRYALLTYIAVCFVHTTLRISCKFYYKLII